MKRRKNIKRVLASLLTLQMILFTGFVAYPQQAYAEETVNNQGNEQYLSEDNSIMKVRKNRMILDRKKKKYRKQMKSWKIL